MEQKNTFIPLTERRRPTVFAAAGLVLIAALGLWVGTLLSLALAPESAAMQELLTAVIYYLPFVLLPPILYGLKHRGLSDGLRLNPMPLLPTLSVILLALMCVYAASAIDSLWVMLLAPLRPFRGGILSIYTLQPPETSLYSKRYSRLGRP